MNFLRRLTRALAARPAAPARPALPVNAGPDQCPMCWVLPGVEHELSCDAVSPALFAAYVDAVRAGAR